MKMYNIYYIVACVETVGAELFHSDLPVLALALGTFMLAAACRLRDE